MKKRIKLKKLKQKILDDFNKNEFVFHVTLIDGTEITNKNIEEYPEYKSVIRKQLTQLWRRKSGHLNSNETAKAIESMLKR